MVTAVPTTQKPGAPRVTRRDPDEDDRGWEKRLPNQEVGEGDRPKTKKPGSGR